MAFDVTFVVILMISSLPSHRIGGPFARKSLPSVIVFLVFVGLCKPSFQRRSELAAHHLPSVRCSGPHRANSTERWLSFFMTDGHSVCVICWPGVSQAELIPHRFGPQLSRFDLPLGSGPRRVSIDLSPSLITPSGAVKASSPRLFPPVSRVQLIPSCDPHPLPQRHEVSMWTWASLRMLAP